MSAEMLVNVSGALSRFQYDRRVRDVRYLYELFDPGDFFSALGKIFQARSSDSKEAERFREVRIFTRMKDLCDRCAVELGYQSNMPRINQLDSLSSAIDGIGISFFLIALSVVVYDRSQGVSGDATSHLAAHNLVRDIVAAHCDL